MIKEFYRAAGVTEQELRSGSRRRTVSALRGELCLHLYRELGLPLAEIARVMEVGTSGVAMAVKGVAVGNSTNVDDLKK